MSQFNWAAATPEERRAYWATKLRSGEYEQTQHTLRDHYGFCCLGVLCDLADPTRWSEVESLDLYGFEADGTTHVEMPPAGILDQVGLSGSEASRVADLNDGGCTFEEIADEIETI